jgi:hypothetical protein
MDFLSTAIGIGSALLKGSGDRGGGSGGGAFIERPQTHSEMLRDIAQAAPIGETGQQGTVQGSTESAAQLESRRKYRQLFLAALQRAGSSASGETQKQVLTEALAMMPSQASASGNPTTVPNRPVRLG